MFTVLIPSDYSALASDTMRFARRLRGDQPTRFVVLHSYVSTPEASTGLEWTPEQAEASLRTRLQDQWRETGEAAADFFVRYGTASEVISALVREESVDLVVMGTTGAEGLPDNLLGTVTESVVKQVSCPVLAVPERCVFTPFHHLVFATDLQDVPAHVLTPLLDLAQQHDGEITLLNVLPEGEMLQAEEVAQALSVNARFAGVKHVLDFTENNVVAAGLENYLNQHSADLLCLVVREHTFLHRLFHTSVTHEVVQHPTLPLLLLHENAA